MGGGEEVASVDCLLHEAAAVLAPPNRVLVFELGRGATHLMHHARGFYVVARGLE